MSTIDSRVVELRFDGKQFEAGVQSTLHALAQLKNGLQFDARATGLADLHKAVGKVDLSPISAATEQVNHSFSTMQAVGVAALAALAGAAVVTAHKIASSLKGSIAEGYGDYELKIGATQTIMAGTGESIGFVSRQLKELDIYADETIYSLSDMVSNIGKFTNAGVKLPVAVNAMKGISNVAALSGANTNEAARAMYNLGQAIGQGTVRLMDWKSVELANMGTKEFKEQLIQSGVAMGTLTKESDGTIKTLEGSEVTYKNFSQTLQDQWLTSEALTKTLSRYADETSKIGKKAYKAATEVKTFGMMMTTLKAAAGTGWTDTFEIVIGKLPQATKLWTEVTNAIGGSIARSADARNKLLGDWKELGGRTALIDGIRNAFEAFGSILTPIKEAFRDIFPPSTGESLYKATVAFRDFFEKLKMGADGASNLKDVFKGIFSVIGIGIDIVKTVVGSIFDLFDAVSISSAGFLDGAAAVGRFFTNLRESLKQSQVIQKFFDGVVDVLSTAMQYIRQFADAIARAIGEFDGFRADVFAKGMENFGEAFKNAKGIAEKAVVFFEHVAAAAKTVGPRIAEAFGNIREQLSNAVSPADFDRILATIQTALGAGIFVTIRQALKRGFGGLGGGFMENINRTLGEVTNTLQTFQGSIRAGTILKIATALGILAVSLLLLSTIEPGKLVKALLGLSAGFAVLTAGLFGITKALGPGGAIQMPLLGAGFMILAGGLLLFAGAMKAFSRLDPNELAQGLIAMSTSLFVINRALTAMSASSGKIVAVGGGLMLLGLALLPIAAALKIMSTMDLGDIAGSLTVLGVSLSIIGNTIRALPKDMMMQALALNAVGISLIVIAGAVALMGAMSWEVITKGLTTLGTALLFLSGGLRAMQGTQSGAFALLIAAAALAVLGPALFVLGNLPWQVIVVGLATMGAALLVLGGAAWLLTPVIPVIVALAGSLLAIGVAMALAGPAAIALATAFGLFLTALAGGTAVILQLVEAAINAIPQILANIARGIIEFARIIAQGAPEILKAFVAILVSLSQAIVKAAPEIAKAFGALFKELLGIIVDNVPVLARAALDLITGIISAIADKGPKLVSEFARMVIGLSDEWTKHMPEMARAVAEYLLAMLTEIANYLPDFIEKGVDIAVAFMEGVGDNAERLATAAGEMIVDFVNGVAEAIRANADALRAAAGNLANAIIDGVTGGLATRASEVARSAANMALNALQSAKNALGISSPSKEFRKVGEYAADGFVKGLIGGKDRVNAGWNLMRDLLRQAVDSAEADIDRLKAKLKELNDAKVKNVDAIARVTSALAAARVEYIRSGAALEVLKGNLEGQRDKLRELGAEYDKFTAKIERAETRLADALARRNDFDQQIRQQYGDLPDITSETGVDQYTHDLANAMIEVDKFSKVLNKLRDMGLNDVMYEEFLAAGPDILPFLLELRKAGEGSITTINELSGGLQKEAHDLGIRTSRELHQAGVDSARGLLQGLRSQRSEIVQEMREIARAIVKALREELKMKSPSRVTSKLGEYVGQGLARGIRKSRPIVDAETEKLGSRAVDSLRKSMSGISEIISADMDSVMTITPILDLTHVRAHASDIDSMLGSKAISVTDSYQNARAAAMLRERTQPDVPASKQTFAEPRAFIFNQYNRSPKALSSAEIYRQTRNQLSVVKGALTTNATPSA